MADTKQTPNKKTDSSCISFPCGNFEKMLKKMRESTTSETKSNAGSSIMKQTRKGKEAIFDCKKLMQHMLAPNNGDIDCRAVIKELFGSIADKKADQDS